MARKRARRTVTSGGANTSDANKKRFKVKAERRTRGTLAPARRLRVRSLTAKQLAAKERVVSGLRALQRNPTLTLSEVRKEYGFDSRTFHKYAASYVLKRERGSTKIRVASGDRLTQHVWGVWADGTIGHRPVQGSKNATTLSHYARELNVALAGGESALEKFTAKWRGVHVDGRELLTDLDKLRELANAGELKTEQQRFSGRGEKR